jgi:hypothetical protein
MSVVLLVACAVVWGIIETVYTGAKIAHDSGGEVHYIVDYPVISIELLCAAVQAYTRAEGVRGKVQICPVGNAAEEPLFTADILIESAYRLIIISTRAIVGNKVIDIGQWVAGGVGQGPKSQ